MKELIQDFKSIYHHDRRVLIMMVFLFLASAFLVFTPIFTLNSATPKIWARYSDITRGYAEGDWWYLLSLSVLGVTLGIAHVLIAARIYSKRGASTALLFLGISLAIVFIASAFLIKILGEG
ncbi:MAG: hypothetical protein LBT19_01625 [Candidatus Nomurabacteria bacterium]|jgi:hypothetical protein|nr:hypothetical protein [Candidatus Nomurabacteria bacterium]